jgi:hypothetical protein
MSEQRTRPTVLEISAYSWETTALEADLPTCHNIADRLLKKAGELHTANDEVGERVYRFIGQLAFMHLDVSNEDAPFRAAVIMGTKRSATLDDYDEEDIAVVHALAGTTKVPALRARFSDILWVKRKDHKAAAQATADYLETFKQIDHGEQWVNDIDSLERGIALARILGSKKALFTEYVAFIEERLTSLEPNCENAYGLHLLDMLADHRSGNLATAARIAESIGDRLEGKGSSFLARDYYDRAGRFLGLLNDASATRGTLLKKGESWVTQAHSCIGESGRGYFAATHDLAMGIESLRQAGADESRIAALHKTLIEWQEKSTGEMQSFTHETDVSQLVEGAREHVKGKSLQDAIFAMALGHPVISCDDLRKRVLENAEQFPLTTLFAGELLASDGRVIAHKPSGFTANEEEREKFIEAEMFHQAAQIDWSVRAQAYIDVCRREIWMAHRPTVRDLQFLVLQNPFIPRGHEPIYLKGIVAGFRGDFDIVAHLLVPQIEESIRHVLKNAGHITSKLDSKLIQEQRLLGTLLAMPETTEVFGRDQVFEMRGLLCEKTGHDLRNRLAHGFLTYNQCWGSDLMNVWWLVIRLLSVPVAQSAGLLTQQSKEETPEKSASEESS